jgi:hypothetical protein
LRRDFRRHLLTLVLVALALPGCGIVFSADFEGTEVFRDFEVEPRVPAGSPVAVAVTVSQPYPVPLAIACAYEDVELTDDERRVAFSERAQMVFEAVLEAGPPGQAGAEDDPPEQVLTFEFIVRDAGTYFLACYTVAAPENGIGRRFRAEAP